MGSNSSPFGTIHDPFPLFRPPSFAPPDGTAVSLGQPTGIFAMPTVDAHAWGETPLPSYAETEKELCALAKELLLRTDRLVSLLRKVDRATSELCSYVATLRGLVGLANLLATRAPFKISDGKVLAKAADLRAKADAVLKKASDQLGQSPSATAAVPNLARDVGAAAQGVIELLEAPTYVNKVKDYADDKKIPEARRLAVLEDFKHVLSVVLDQIPGTPAEKKIAELADGMFSVEETGADPASSVLSAVSSGANVLAAATGNIPWGAPDPLYLAAARCYAVYYLPKASVSQAQAKSLEGVVLNRFLRAMNMKKQDKVLFREYFIRLANSQHALAVAQVAKANLQNRPNPDAARIEAKQQEIEKLQAKVQTEERRVRDFFEQNDGNKFIRFQNTFVFNATLTLISIVQLYSALAKWGDPETPTLQSLIDIAGAGAGVLAGTVVTLNRIPISIPFLKNGLSHVERLVMAADGALTVGFAVLNLVTGGISLWQGFFGKKNIDWEKVGTGAGQVVSAAAVLLGICMASPGLQAFGIAIGFGIMAYQLIKDVIDALKTATEKVMMGYIDLLEDKNLSWDGSSISAALKCQAEFAAFKQAAEQMSWFNVPLNPAEADRDEIVKVVAKLGFGEKAAKEMVDEPAPPASDYDYSWMMTTP